ncbi:hypothetical protein VXQ18_17235 [Brucella abortus]|nr:hypothetical protein [Brucella abortus]
MRKDVANENKLAKPQAISANIFAGGGKVVLAASSEFVNSAAALLSFPDRLWLYS